MLVRMVGSRVKMIAASLIPRTIGLVLDLGVAEERTEVDEALAQADVKEIDSVDELIKDLKS